MAAFLTRVNVTVPGVEHVSLDDAAGRVLAREIVADADYPNAARSAMDGFALSAENTPGAFEVIGDVGMGAAPQAAVTPSTAMRIPTGGVLPRGADAVVPIEDARVNGSSVDVDGRIEAGDSVIERGADMRRGDRVLQAGRRIGAPQVGLLATLGIVEVPVYRRPVVAVLSSGDELVAPSAALEPGSVRDSNRYAIAASLRAMGAQPRHYPVVRDELDALIAALAGALAECDAVAVTGGSSVGERDFLRQAIEESGEPGVVVAGLRIKPGKPALFGAVGGKPILGLPGNPMSALLVLEAVAAPIVAAMTGAPAPRLTVPARLAEPVRSRPGWTWYVPVGLRQDDDGTSVAQPLPVRSFSVRIAAQADGYIIMNERDDEWPAATAVTVHRFHACGGN